MSEKKISVILPIYNVEQYLDRCVNCLVKQTYNNLEIILIDDGSPDNCPQLCDSWAKRDDRIVVIHKGNAGVSSARNAGIDIATGEYISFIDPDDVVPEKYFEIMMSGIQNTDCVICKFKTFNDSVEFEVETDINVDYLSRFDAINLGLSDRNEIFYVVWNKVIKSEIVKKFRFNQTMKNGEDTYFAFDIINACNSVAVLNNKLYGYYERADSAVKQIDVKGKKDKLNASKHVFDECSNLTTELKDKARRIYFWKIVDNYSKKNKELFKDEKFFLRNNKDILLNDSSISIKGKLLTIISIL